MGAVLLHHKLRVPPLSPYTVPRLHLMQRLEESLRQNHRLALISAPAGFGKTSLLREWIEWLPGNTLLDPVPQGAWLALDDDDNNPARFWSYVLAALRNVQPGLAESAGPDDERDARSLLLDLLNDLARLPGRIVLVLDDYHAVTSAAVHEDVIFLLEHMPPQLLLAVATRVDPPLPIGRLRAGRQLTEMRTGDLRFTPGEADRFLNERMRLGLTADDVRALTARTEGWAVGLQLAAAALARGANPQTFVATFSGSHRYVLEYLIEEVFNRQPEPVQRFLLQTSILGELCGPLCAAVTGHTDSAALLAQLLRENVFVLPLDDEQRWYRYHQLFAELLGDRLTRETPAEQIAELHRRAGAWHERYGTLEAAARHAGAAHDFEHVTALAEQAARQGALHDWIVPLHSRVAGRPAGAWCARAWANIALAYACLWSGELDEAAAAARAAEELAQAGGAPAARACALQAGAEFERGRLQRARALYRRAVELAGETAGRPAVEGYLGLADVALEQNQLDEAAGHLDRAMALCAGAGSAGERFRALVLRARLALAQGDPAAAHAALDEAEQVCPGDGARGHALDLLFAAAQVRLCLAAGDVEGAARQAGERAPAPTTFEEARRLLQARVSLAHDDRARALALAERVLTWAQAGGRAGRVAESCLLMALASEPGPHSLAVLQRALELTGPEGFVRLYLDEGTRAARLLEAFTRLPSAPAPAQRHARDLLARFTQAAPAAAAGLAEPLSAREREVLRLVSAGCSNHEIAHKLSITGHTVKKHLSNIFGKLGVNSRTQALARAREIGLL
jgi:LuxR family maltose regulon positive regulatory protein